MRTTPSHPPFTTNEKARRVHCVACPEFRPCVEVMLRRVMERVAIDNKLSLVQPFKEFAIILNDDEIVFDNFVVDHAHNQVIQIEYNDNSGHLNYHLLMASSLNRYWWDKRTSDCTLYCQHCVVCHRAKPDRRGEAALQPLEITKYPWGTVGIDNVTDVCTTGTYVYTTTCIMICHLPYMAHYVQCHKEIAADESANLFISNC